MAKRKPSKGLAPAAITPKLKKDGTPWTPWADEVALRLAAKGEKLAVMTPEQIALDRKARCSAFTTGVHGPKRPCDRWRMAGMEVCFMHGGGSPVAKKAAKRRLLEELDPTISALIDLRDQRKHMPSALGAAIHIINRVLGKADATQTKLGDGAPIINIGINLGGLPIKPGQLQVAASTSKPPSAEDDDDETVEGEFTADDTDE